MLRGTRWRCGLKGVFRLAVGLILIGFFFVPLAYADIAPPDTPPGGNPQPEDSTTQVQMIAETVIIEVMNPASLGDDEDNLADDRARVHAQFTMLNTADETESMLVRFPLMNPSGMGDGFGGYPEIQDLRAWIDYLPVQVERITTPTTNTWDDDAPPIAWAAFPVDFPPEEEVLVEVRYTLDSTGYEPFSEFKYILETGSGWKDVIGEATVILRLPYPVEPLNLRLDRSSEGAEIIEGELVWHFEDFEPTQEDNIHIVMVETPAWYEVRFASSNLEDSPEDGDAWGALARAYKKIALGPKGWTRDDDAGQKIFSLSREAYETALEYSPEVARWYAGYAELIWHSMFGELYPEPDLGSPSLMRTLELLDRALVLDPGNEQAITILQEMSYSFPEHIVTVDSGFDLILLTSTVEPSSVPMMTLTPIPPPTATARPTRQPTIAPGEGEDPAASTDSKSVNGSLDCLRPVSFLGVPVMFVLFSGIRKKFQGRS